MKKNIEQRSAWDWNTKVPSCMYTVHGHRTAQKVAEAGKAMDMLGRAVISMHPRHEQAISINPNGKQSADRNDSIRRGGI
jgi:hypothetical protein